MGGELERDAAQSGASTAKAVHSDAQAQGAGRQHVWVARAQGAMRRDIGATGGGGALRRIGMGAV